MTQCEPCQDKKRISIATLRLAGVPVCNRCARGDGNETTGRFTYADESDPIPEPKATRGSVVPPRALSPAEKSEARIVTLARPSTPPPASEVVEFVVPESLLLEVDVKTERVSDPIVQLIFEETAAALGMNMNDYLVKSNKVKYVHLRHISIWIVCEYTNIGYASLGRLMGMHHTTVIDAEQVMSRRMKTDSGLHATAKAIWKAATERRRKAKTASSFTDTQWAKRQQEQHTRMVCTMNAVTNAMQGGRHA